VTKTMCISVIKVFMALLIVSRQILSKTKLPPYTYWFIIHESPSSSATPPLNSSGLAS